MALKKFEDESCGPQICAFEVIFCTFLCLSTYVFSGKKCFLNVQNFFKQIQVFFKTVLSSKAFREFNAGQICLFYCLICICVRYVCVRFDQNKCYVNKLIVLPKLPLCCIIYFVKNSVQIFI